VRRPLSESGLAWAKLKRSKREYEMTSTKARKYLRKLLCSFTNGAILHLLAELSVEEAIEARRKGNELLYQRLSLVEAGLIVAGYGVDAVCPDYKGGVVPALKERHLNNGERNHG
jgi:hypothetical protein